MDKMRVLIVDDEENIRKVLGAIVEDEGAVASLADSAEAARLILLDQQFDLIFLDVWLPGIDGMTFLGELIQFKPGTSGGGSICPVVMISGHGTIDMAVQAVKTGAYDFIEKPLSLERVSAVLRNIHEMVRLRRENLELREKLLDGETMVGSSTVVEGLKHLIRQAATTNAPVFIFGENGTGKELVARTIHRQSSRSAKPFIALNCAAIPEALIESELFGYEKGAFTGAVNQKKGRFELADGGTLFLDEVVDLSAAAQAKLLRVLQDMAFERIGGEKSIKVDVRIVAASNKDLRTEVQAGTFREDLFYRLHVLPIQVPTLAKRSEDIPLLCQHFLAIEADAQARPVPALEPGALAVLKGYEWPGNIRQLKNIIQRLMVICDDSIDSASVARALGQDRLLTPVIAPSSTDDFWATVAAMDLQSAKDEFERRFLLLKLEEHNYNITRTAQNLGMYPSNLHAKIRKYHLER